MCGFAGFLSFRPGQYPVEERARILRAMSAAISHRGPDDEQFYDDGVLSLVFRRLSLVDMERGAQPFFNEDRSLLLVANGEIYNHLALRDSLRGRARFATGSDCEAALHAFAHWGTDAIGRCHGMFAMAFWDVRARRLTLARDRLGIKPLYVCETPDGVIFGSELKAMLQHPRCPHDVDLSSLETDAQAPSSRQTYVRGVEFLPAAHYQVIAGGAVFPPRAYWRLEDAIGLAPYGQNEDAYVDSLQDLLTVSASEHLQGDGAVALHLSGGLDSTLLAALVARQTRDAPCFTLVERTTLMVGDVESARFGTQHLGLDWYPVLFDYRSVLDDLSFGLASMEQAVWMMDAPRFDSEWMMKSELTRAIRHHRPDIKAIILGQGADEFAGGYSRRVDSPRASWSRYLTDEIRPMLNAHAVQGELSMTETEIWGLVDPGAARNGGPGAYHHAMRCFVRQLQHHNLWHEDRTSAWQSMEARVPYLDHRVVELLASIPATLHETLLWNKEIMRRCIGRIFPAFDKNRPKVGFCMTNDMRSVDIVVHGMACRSAGEFLDKYVAEDGFPFDREEVRSLVRRVRGRAPGFYSDSYHLLGIMCAAIFKYQCEHPSLIPGRGAPVSCLPVVQPRDWPRILERMQAQPVIRRRWRAEDTLSLPEGGSVANLRLVTGGVRFSLLKDGQAHSEIVIDACPEWLVRLVTSLASLPGRTLGAWCTDLGVLPGESAALLDALYQSGFVVSGEESAGKGP